MANTLIILLKKCDIFTPNIINLFDNTLVTTVNEFVINEFVKHTMLEQLDPALLSFSLFLGQTTQNLQEGLTFR